MFNFVSATKIKLMLCKQFWYGVQSSNYPLFSLTGYWRVSKEKAEFLVCDQALFGSLTWKIKWAKHSRWQESLLSLPLETGT